MNELDARRRRAGRQAWGLVAAMGCGLALIVFVARPLSSGRRPAVVRAASPSRSPPTSPSPSPSRSPGGPPASLAGTDVDGALEIDGDGELRVNRDLRRFFDYFLTASGEEDEAAVRARIVAAARARLPVRAFARLVSVLDRYLEVRRALRALTEAGALPDDLGERLAAMRRVRAEHMPGGDGDAFFAEDEKLAELALERRRLADDPNLTDAERRRIADELDAETPEVRTARTETLRPLAAFQREAELRAAGASPEEVDRARAELLGRDAADRLAELDRQRAAFDARLARYRAKKAEIERSLPNADERAAAVAALLQASFTPAEAVRVRALDRTDGDR